MGSAPRRMRSVQLSKWGEVYSPALIPTASSAWCTSVQIDPLPLVPAT
mgnify:CR=1 FL=1